MIYDTNLLIQHIRRDSPLNSRLIIPKYMRQISLD